MSFTVKECECPPCPPGCKPCRKPCCEHPLVPGGGVPHTSDGGFEVGGRGMVPDAGTFAPPGAGTAPAAAGSGGSSLAFGDGSGAATFPTPPSLLGGSRAETGDVTWPPPFSAPGNVRGGYLGHGGLAASAGDGGPGLLSRGAMQPLPGFSGSYVHRAPQKLKEPVAGASRHGDKPLSREQQDVVRRLETPEAPEFNKAAPGSLKSAGPALRGVLDTLGLSTTRAAAQVAEELAEQRRSGKFVPEGPDTALLLGMAHQSDLRGNLGQEFLSTAQLEAGGSRGSAAAAAAGAAVREMTKDTASVSPGVAEQIEAKRRTERIQQAMASMGVGPSAGGASQGAAESGIGDAAAPDAPQGEAVRTSAPEETAQPPEPLPYTTQGPVPDALIPERTAGDDAFSTPRRRRVEDMDAAYRARAESATRSQEAARARMTNGLSDHAWAAATSSPGFGIAEPARRDLGARSAGILSFGRPAAAAFQAPRSAGPAAFGPPEAAVGVLDAVSPESTAPSTPFGVPPRDALAPARRISAFRAEAPDAAVFGGSGVGTPTAVASVGPTSPRTAPSVADLSPTRAVAASGAMAAEPFAGLGEDVAPRTSAADVAAGAARADGAWSGSTSRSLQRAGTGSMRSAASRPTSGLDPEAWSARMRPGATTVTPHTASLHPASADERGARVGARTPAAASVPAPRMHPVALELAASRGGKSLQRASGGWKPARRASPSGRWLLTPGTADVIGLAASGASGPADPTTALASVNTLRPRTTLPTDLPEYGAAIDVERERAKVAARAGRAAFGRTAGRAGRAPRAPGRSQAVVDERLAAPFGVGDDGASGPTRGAPGAGASPAEGFFTDDAAARLAGFGGAPDLAISQAGRGKGTADPLQFLSVLIQKAVVEAGLDLSLKSLSAVEGHERYFEAAARALEAELRRAGTNVAAQNAAKARILAHLENHAYRNKLAAWKKGGRKGPKPKRSDKDVKDFAKELLEYLLRHIDELRRRKCPCPCEPGAGAGGGGGDGKPPSEPGAKGALAASVTGDSGGGATEESVPPPRWEPLMARSEDRLRTQPPIWEPYWPEFERWNAPRAPGEPPFGRTGGNVRPADMGTEIYAQEGGAGAAPPPPGAPEDYGLKTPYAVPVGEDDDAEDEDLLEALIDEMLLEFLETLFELVGPFDVPKECWNYLRATLRPYLIARASLCAAAGEIALLLESDAKLRPIHRDRAGIELEGLGLRVRAVDLDMLNVLAPALRTHVQRYDDDGPGAILPFLTPLVTAVAARRHDFWDHLRNEAVQLLYDAHALNLRDDQVARKEHGHAGYRVSEISGRWMRFMHQSIGVRNGMAAATSPLNYHAGLKTPAGRDALAVWERQTEPPNAWIAECERDMEKHGAWHVFWKNAARGALHTAIVLSGTGHVFRGASLFKALLGSGLVAGAADVGLQSLDDGEYSTRRTLSVAGTTMLGAALFRWARAERGMAGVRGSKETEVGFGTKLRRFIYDPRDFRVIRKEYFGPGGAGGKSLHHWMFPRAAKHIPQGFRNAGWNLLEVPKIPKGLVGRFGLERMQRVGGPNQWMGLAPNWKSRPIEAALAESMDEVVRTGVVVTAVGSGIVGYQSGAKIAEHIVDEER